MHEGIGFVANNGTLPSLDMFNRQLTVTPTTIFQTQFTFNQQQEFVEFLTTGTASTFFDVSKSLVELTVNAPGDKAVVQSREYVWYQPGKIQAMFATSVLHYTGTFDNSVVVRVGIFDDYRDKNTPGSSNPGTGVEVNQKSMGHFFEISGNEWVIVERENSPDNVTKVTRVPQANWNLDTLDGNRATSPSGYIISRPLNSGYLLTIQRQWLGVGAVRLGIVINGRIIFCHMFHHRNLTGPYTHLSKLPLRWEIEKVAGGAAAPASTAAICGSVQIFGDYNPFGSLFALPITLATEQTLTTTSRPFLILRLQQRYCRATFKLVSIDIYTLASGGGSTGLTGYTIHKNPTISGTPALTFTAFPDSRSMLEYCYVGTPSNYTLTDGIPFRSGFVERNTSSLDGLRIDELITSHSFCSDIKGNCDTLVIAAKQIVTNNRIYITARWLELI